MTFLLPLLLGLAHGVSDASAGLLVGLIIQQRAPAMNLQILQYNLLAFGLQPLAGLLFDRINQPRLGAATGLLITLTGLLTLTANMSIAIFLIGIGSACLHAGGGSVAITSQPGKASSAGVFAAFGVAGLALGGLASLSHADIARLVLVVLLAILALTIRFTRQSSEPETLQTQAFAPLPYLILATLLIAIALRSTAWVGTQMSVERTSSAALWLALAAGTGKLLGGFGADRFGWKRWMLASLTSAGGLLVFSGAWLPGLMLGALLLQSVTPLSIAAVGQAMPKFPALAASLTLGTAIIAGGLPFFMLAGGWFGPALLAVILAASIFLYWTALKNSSSTGQT